MELVKWDEIEKQIDGARDFKTFMEMHTRMGIIATLAKKSKQIEGSLKVSNRANKYRFYIEQDVGRIYKALPKESGGDHKSEAFQNSDNLNFDSTKEKARDETGRTADTLSRWVGEADIEKDLIEEYEAKCNEGGKEFTSSGLVRLSVQKNSDEKDETPEAIEQEYDVIVVDPPWKLKKILRDVRPNQTNFAYKQMDIEEVESFEMPVHVSSDCHLFLWTTQKYLPCGFEIMKAWDFKYVCTFVWHKPGGFQPAGLPQYNCEFVLYGRLGSPKFVDTKSFNLCFDGKRGGHSEKPQEFYDMIKRTTGGKCIEIFARKIRDGFDGWGAEYEGLEKR